MLEVGSILDGKYKILNVIGRGGMSVVYLAINERANKTWAVKEVRKDGGNDRSVVSQNLLAETEMLKKLDHPNLPAIVDVIDQDDCFIIVMDYIEGNSLLDLLEERGRQEQDQVVEWAKQLCDVLGYLHTRHPPIIYRDVKPANVMLRPSGSIALVDFGTAREYKQTGEGDTAWLGTRGYAAPEQFGSMGQTDVRTDIYNLGATMFHLITGIVPAGQETFVHPIGEFIPGYAGSGLEKVILKCCRYHPRERYQSCAELMYALDHVHDIDAWEIRKRRAKLFAFGACMALSLVWAAAGFGFRCACAGTRGEMYRRNVSDAMDEPSFSKKTAYYLAAVTLEPGNPEAYNNLIDDVELEPELTDEVYNGVKACIDSRDADPAHRKTAIEFLRKEDPRAYADFNFRFGSLVYLGYPGGKGNAAREYLVNAIDSGGLEGNRLAAAAMMYELADAYRKKIKSDSSSRKKGIEIGEGCGQYWNTLEKLAGNLESLYAETGNIGYPVRVCDEVANELDQHTVSYQYAGISAERLRNTLSNVRSFMAEMSEKAQSLSPAAQEEIARVDHNVSLAEERLNSQDAGGTNGY